MNRTWWSVMVILVGAVLLAFVNGAYTNYVQHQSDERNKRFVQVSQQRWCALLDSLDHPEVPATTERGRQIQTQIHQLRLGLGCGGTP